MTSEVNDYIVKFVKDAVDFSQTSEKVDGFLKLSTTNNSVPVLHVRSHKDERDIDNHTLLYKFITKNFAEVNFDDRNRTCLLNYKDGYSRSVDYRSMIEFDENSQSAYKTFKSSFETLLNTKSETQYYASGRIRYIGEVIEIEDEEGDYNGNGTIYYDSYSNSRKYKGEFEEGEYDGSGIFYNQNSNIKILANNISNGIPNQKGKLYINFKSREEIIDFEFTDLWSKLEMADKKKQRMFVSSDKFVDKVSELYWGNFNKSMDDVIFEEKSSGNQNIELRNRIIELQTKILEMEQKSKNSEKSYKVAGQFFVVLIFINIVLNLIAINT